MDIGGMGGTPPVLSLRNVPPQVREAKNDLALGILARFDAKTGRNRLNIYSEYRLILINMILTTFPKIQQY